MDSFDLFFTLLFYQFKGAGEMLTNSSISSLSSDVNVATDDLGYCGMMNDYVSFFFGFDGVCSTLRFKFWGYGWRGGGFSSNDSDWSIEAGIRWGRRVSTWTVCKGWRNYSSCDANGNDKGDGGVSWIWIIKSGRGWRFRSTWRYWIRMKVRQAAAFTCWALVGSWGQWCGFLVSRFL